ncbi:MAG: type IV pilus assembly protein PilM [Akkermansia sp.]
MADNKKTSVALEVGAQSVTMAVFTATKRGYSLARYARRDIVLDPVEEAMRLDYMSNAIAELVTELKVKGSEVNNIVSGQQVVMRFIKLPNLDMEDLREQVGYEAQQHIPFPLDDITYDYHDIGLTEDGDREVLLVAIKKNVLDEINTQVQASSLRTKSVDCSITSLYNTFRASYPDEMESTMIVDIGAKTTDIIFSENGRFFTRSVNSAGGYITAQIAREHGMKYRDAEALKVSNGVIALGNGHTDSLSPEDAALATTIRTAMGRVSSEIQRTINYYRSQYKGSAPVKVYLCGGGSRLPYIQEFLQSAINLPVDFLNPLAEISIGKKVDEEELANDVLSLGPVVGVAVAAANASELKIDLVPTSVGKERAEKELIPKVVTAGCIALAGAAFFAWAGFSAQSDAQARLNRAEAAFANADAIAQRVSTAESAYSRQLKQLEEIKDLFAMRYAYPDVMIQITEKSPSVKFWLTEFAPLINYDVEANDLAGLDDVKGVRLVDMTRSRSAQANSSINTPGEDPNVRNKSEAQVTAIFVTGYTLKNPDEAAGAAHREIIRNLINNNFDERNKDSLFSYTSEAIQSNENKYIRFITTKESKGKIPSYLEKFMLIMPLKQPISIPELQNKED